MNPFQQEWALLHSDIEKYERLSLIIKLFSIAVFLFSIVYGFELLLGISLLIILWLQEGIWKTFQKRLESRVMYIENTLKLSQVEDQSQKDELAFQLYSQWQKQRQGIIGLITEYLFNASKPTVAYPHVVLILLFLFVSF